MKWRLIDKKSVQAPKTGSYGDWKPQLAQEGEYQCVYCCIHEASFGGIRNFHVEHYRPQSKFSTLKNTYSNLFYACGVCNILKSDDWPRELIKGDFTQSGYPDPSQVDYGHILEVNHHSGVVTSNSITGKYIIERLHLNRPHLIGLRAWSEIIQRLKRVNIEISVLIDAGIKGSECEAVMRTLLDINSLMFQLASIRPYAPDQLNQKNEPR